MSWRPPASTSPRGILTGKQVEVLEAAADGLSVAATASRMCVVPTTVKWHRSQLMVKLGVSTMAAAVARGFREGLLELPDALPRSVVVDGVRYVPDEGCA